MTRTGKPRGRDIANLLCVGLGYAATALARRLATAGTGIAGTARDDKGATEIAEKGWRGHVFDGGTVSAPVADAVAEATHILLSAPPTQGGDPALSTLGPHIARSGRLEWIGYLSTVGVYGDHGGQWVDETTPCRDPGAQGQLRLDAECAWSAFGAEHGKRVEIFRLPGIYGPGRSQVDQLLAGTARRIHKPGQVFNRIHVEDIAAALEAAMTTPSSHTVFNIVDDEPAPADEVVAYAAELLGMSPPPLVRFEDASVSPSAARFYTQSKRCSNRRMKEVLGVRLTYPTYREGLAAIVAALPAKEHRAPG